MKTDGRKNTVLFLSCLLLLFTCIGADRIFADHAGEEYAEDALLLIAHAVRSCRGTVSAEAGKLLLSKEKEQTVFYVSEGYLCMEKRHMDSVADGEGERMLPVDGLTVSKAGNLLTIAVEAGGRRSQLRLFDAEGD